tara:strand:+ start:582 stop:791 length:210 start_codon:yes stop_codon:yes gene_type:complete
LVGAAAVGPPCAFPHGLAARASDVFATVAGNIEVFPIGHASFVMETPKGVIYNAPVGEVADYSDLKRLI